MKKTISVLLVNMLVAGTLFISCDTTPEREQVREDLDQEPDNQTEEARQDEIRQEDINSQQDLNRTGEVDADQGQETEQQIDAEYQDFREETDERLNQYEEDIDRLREDAPDQSEGSNENYDNRVDELENDLNELRNDIENYNSTTQDNWDNFRGEFGQRINDFNRRMNDLDQNRDGGGNSELDLETVPDTEAGGRDADRDIYPETDNTDTEYDPDAGGGSTDY